MRQIHEKYSHSHKVLIPNTQIPYCTILYILYCTILYCTILYGTVRSTYKGHQIPQLNLSDRRKPRDTKLEAVELEKY